MQDSVLPRVQGCEPLPEGRGGEVAPTSSSFLYTVGDVKQRKPVPRRFNSRRATPSVLPLGAVEGAVLDGFEEVGLANYFCAVHVCDGSSHTKDAGVSASR